MRAWFVVIMICASLSLVGVALFDYLGVSQTQRLTVEQNNCVSFCIVRNSSVAVLPSYVGGSCVCQTRVGDS